MDTQTQIDRLIELAIIQRSELKQLVEQLPQLREHLNAEVEKVFDETEPQLRAELEEWTTKQTADKTAALGVTLEAKIADLAKSLEVSTQARYNAIIAERAENARLAAQAEAKIAEHAASLPSAVKEIVSAELARFPRAGEIDQLRKEFAEPRGLNPRGKWQAGESYSKLDFVTINGDSYASNIDNNRTRPSRSSADWTLVAARGTGGGGGPTSLSELTTVPSDGDVLIGSGTSWVTSNLTAGAGISITVGPGAITISATDGDITLDDGTAASPSLHFTNDPDTGIYRPAANTLGISVSGTQVAYFDENGLTVPSAGVVAGGSFHGANGNANNPSFSFTSDQDTGFYRHGTNELGISIGGTEKAVMTSTTFSITPNVSTSGNLTVSGTSTIANGTAAAPSLVFAGSTTTGLYRYGANVVGLAMNGLHGFAFNGAGEMYGPGVNGYVSLPSAGGVSLTAGGTNQNITLTPTGTGRTIINANSLALNVTGTNDTSLVYGRFGTSGSTGQLFVGVEGSVAGSLNTGTLAYAGYIGTASSGTALQLGTAGGVRATITSTGNLLIGTTSDAANARLNVLGANNAGIRVDQGSYNYHAAFEHIFSSLSYTTEYARIKSNGNLLIGTTTDSGARLQVGTDTTTAANGMKFGTDVSLFRSAAGVLRLASTSNYAHEIVNTAGTGGAITSYSNTGGYLFVGIDSSSGGALGGGAYAGVISRDGAYSLIFRTNTTTALTLDSSQNATFAGRVKAGTAYGTAKSVEVNEAFTTQAQNTTKTVTVALPGGANGATFVLDVGAYGNSGTGYGSLLVKGAGYLGSSTTYDAAEIVKANSGSVTVSSVTKGNGQLTFTVINTSGTVSISVKLTATAGDDISTLPAITIA